MRNVVSALAESEFGVPRGSYTLLVAFIVAAVADIAHPNRRASAIGI